jgi:hypothetical protein
VAAGSGMRGAGASVVKLIAARRNVRFVSRARGSSSRRDVS